MALSTLFNTGYEHGVAPTTNGGGLFSTITGAPTVVAGSARHGSFGLHIAGAADTSDSVQHNVTANAQVVCRVAIRCTSLPVGNSTPLELRGSGAFGIQMVSGGALNAFIGAGTVANGDSHATLADGNWHIIEMQASGTNNTWTMDWKVDGYQQTQATLANGATGTISLIELGTHATTQVAFTCDYDDVIVGTWTVAGTDWYGDGQGLGQIAGSDGTHATVADFSFGDAGSALSGTVTTAFTQVNSTPGTAGWTTTRSSTTNLAMRVTNTAAHLAVLPVTTAQTGTANAVRGLLSYSSSTTSANLAACDVRNSAGTVTALNGTTGGTGATFNVVANQFKGGIVTTPVAGWVASEVNQVLFRFGGCTSSDISPVPTVQALMVEVDWPISAGVTLPPQRLLTGVGL